MNSMEPHFTYRGILLGPTGVGKSSIVHRLSQGLFDPGMERTIGCDLATVALSLNELRIKLYMWDTAGDERFYSITRAYLRDLSFALVVFDVGQARTLQQAEEWIGIVRERCGHCNIQVWLLGNKTDRLYRELSREEGQAVADRLQVTYREVSAKEDTNIHAVVCELTKSIHESTRPEFVDDRIHGVRSDVKPALSLAAPTMRERTCCMYA